MRNKKLLVRFSVIALFFMLVFGLLIRYLSVYANESLQVSSPASSDLPIEPTEASQEQTALRDMPPFSQVDVRYRNGIPRLTILDIIIPNRPWVDVVTHEVQPGDNLFAIANKYGLQPETVLWGNFDVLQDNPQFLSPGQDLNILPTDGVYYQWNEGDDLQAVAVFFGAEPGAILEYPGNRLDPILDDQENPSIASETWLVVPGGRRALRHWGPPAITRANPAAAKFYGSGYCGEIYQGAIGIGTCVWPTVLTYLSGYDFNPNINPGLVLPAQKAMQFTPRTVEL